MPDAATLTELHQVTISSLAGNNLALLGILVALCGSQVAVQSSAENEAHLRRAYADGSRIVCARLKRHDGCGATIG
jgi:hypothetical protein